MRSSINGGTNGGITQLTNKVAKKCPTGALCTLTPLITYLGSSRLQIVDAVYDSSYDNHPLSQKLDPRLIPSDVDRLAKDMTCQTSH